MTRLLLFLGRFRITVLVGNNRTDNIDPRQGPSEISVPKREMLFIKDNLGAAESARRRGDTSAVYKAYNRWGVNYLP